MNTETLINILKKYVKIFIQEYGKYLNDEERNFLNNIDYEKIISFSDIPYPYGIIYLNQILLSSNISNLIDSMKNMPNYKTSRYPLNNKNYSSYLEYICQNGYDSINYYSDHLMYLIFKLVTKNNSSLINGFINKEIGYLSNKYRLRTVNLYKREEVIATKVIRVIKRETILKIMFMDKPSAFKYLSENLGYRYAKYVYDIETLMNNDSSLVSSREYYGNMGIINYAKDYDNISYGDVYNYLLEFSIKNI